MGESNDKLRHTGHKSMQTRGSPCSHRRMAGLAESRVDTKATDRGKNAREDLL